MKNEPYTVKLNSEVKKEWQGLVNRIVEEQGLTTIGEAYPYIINLIGNQASVRSSSLGDYINNIRLNLDSVLKNVIAIDEVYKSTLENNEEAINQAKANLVSQLEKQIEANKDLTDKNKSLNEEVKELKAELHEAYTRIETLESEKKQLITDQETQEKILKILSQIEIEEPKENESRTEEGKAKTNKRKSKS